MNNDYEVVYNLYSFWIIILPLFYSTYIIFENKKYLLLSGFIITFLLHYFIKKITTVIPETPDYLIRPFCAKDCNLLNNDGPCDDEPGFPSGHVATTSFFFNYLLLRFINNFDINNLKYIILYNIPVLLTGISRYYKKCHNNLQIVSGYILGIIIAILINRFEK